MSSAALALEGVAGKFAAEAIRQDAQGDRNGAVTSYQRAIDALVKLIQLFPDNTLNAVYEQHCEQYKKRINELQSSPDNYHPQNDNEHAITQNHINSSQTTNSNLENMIIKEKPNVSWKEVIGLEDVKTALRESIVYPAKKPELFTLGWPRGILLYGPPGCGKTMLAAATASEINGYFINVDAASMMSKWLGDAEKNVSQLFHMARDSSKKENVPVIMLIDEVDSLLGNSQNENGGEIDLTNTGSVSLSGPFSVSSNIDIDSNCPSEPASLSPGSKITCTTTYTVTQADLDAGSVVNIAQGNGFLGTEQIISNLDSSRVGAIQGPALTLVKTALQTTYGSADEVIFYNFELTNTGNVTLEAPFTITDDKATDEVCPGEMTSLAPGASLTCTASYTIAPEDISAGEVINVATGHVFFGTAPVDSNSDTETITFMPNPSLTLVKSATPTTYETVSDVISYSFLLTNTGNVTLEAPFTITDDKTTNESCPGTPTSLAPGASITCTASYTITLEDISAGEVINIATGHGFSGMTPVNSNSDTKTVTYLTNPALTLEKSAFPTTYIAVDDVIGYSFLLTNSGNVTLTAPFTVADSKATDESCPGTPASLAPGGKITCTASYTITQADLNAGSVTNTAQGQGFFGTTAVNSNSDSETVTAVQNPALTLVKTATPETYDSVVAMIADRLHLTCSGNVRRVGPITVTDNKATDESCPGTPASLAPGASITCTARVSTDR